MFENFPFNLGKEFVRFFRKYSNRSGSPFTIVDVIKRNVEEKGVPLYRIVCMLHEMVVFSL